MIDYRANVVAFEAFRHALATETIAEPKLAKLRDQHVLSVDQDPQMALLGAMTNHLLWHASSDGAELALVERAASLWETGLLLYQKMTDLRSDLEVASSAPDAPDAEDKLASARQRGQELGDGVAGKEVEIAVLREDIYDAAHPHAHPRQEDKRLDRWTWSDIALARRTDALARAMLRDAVDGPTTAFALGALSSYGGNACGSGYIGQAVGGPRRSHRHRNRLASNTVGSWFGASNPNASSLIRLAEQLRFGLLGPTLPPAIEATVLGALKETYDLKRTPPLPDLQLGYERMLRHLRLLNTFKIPPPPTLPIEPFLTQIYGDTASPPFSIVQALIEAEKTSPAGGGPGVTPQNMPQGSALGQQDSRRNSKLDCGAFFMALFRFIALAALLWAPCWGKSTCKLWEDMKHDFGEWWASLWGGQGASNIGSSAQQLSSHPPPPLMTELILGLYETQQQFWEALNSAYAFLANCGHIYPDELLDRKLFKQFLTLPSAPLGWPHRPLKEAAELAHLYPTSPIEQPASSTPTYPAGSQPMVFVTGLGAGGAPFASQLSMTVWLQAAARVVDAPNYDLDADRGLTHHCWVAEGSINDQPLQVAALPYNQT